MNWPTGGLSQSAVHLPQCTLRYSEGLEAADQQCSTHFVGISLTYTNFKISFNTVTLTTGRLTLAETSTVRGIVDGHSQCKFRGIPLISQNFSLIKFLRCKESYLQLCYMKCAIPEKCTKTELFTGVVIGTRRPKHLRIPHPIFVIYCFFFLPWAPFSTFVLLLYQKQS